MVVLGANQTALVIAKLHFNHTDCHSARSRGIHEHSNNDGSCDFAQDHVKETMLVSANMREFERIPELRLQNCLQFRFGTANYSAAAEPKPPDYLDDSAPSPHLQPPYPQSVAPRGCNPLLAAAAHRK